MDRMEQKLRELEVEFEEHNQSSMSIERLIEVLCSRSCSGCLLLRAPGRGVCNALLCVPVRVPVCC